MITLLHIAVYNIFLQTCDTPFNSSATIPYLKYKCKNFKNYKITDNFMLTTSYNYHFYFHNFLKTMPCLALAKIFMTIRKY